MPIGAPRPCTYTGCSELTTTGRCGKHPRENWTAYQGGKTSTQRGYGAKWRKVRTLAMKRDNGLCQLCLPIITKATEVDHIKPKAQGGTDALDNLQSLCKACHRAKTAQEGR